LIFANTKIQPPRLRAAFVERGPVQARLGEALRGNRAALLCAPAGYGKTTLLARALSQLPAGSAVAWVSADLGDDLQRLLECMVAALEPFDPPWRTAPEALVTRASGSDDELRAVAAELINALDACETPRGVVVFDDLHRVDDPAFFRFLDLLIERLSPRWCLALTARSEPPIALARLRAAGELAEFRQLQLQFARDEARVMARGAGVDDALADRLFDRTQGWPAGLRIALGALQGLAQDAAGRGAERALRAGDRPMFEFLVTEVLGQLAPDLADFLLAVSVLPELDTERCAQVAGALDAGRLLDEVERMGLFVDVLDTPVRTLRLHDLFREALQQRLLQLDAPRLAELRRRAAAAEADPVRRIGLLLQAGEADAAARLAFDQLPRLIVTAGPASAQHVLNQFPPSVRDRSAELAFVRAMSCWALWDFPGMLAQLERAARGFEAGSLHEQLQLARVHSTMALMALGRVRDAAERLAQLRAQPMSATTRILLLNAEFWLAIDDCRHAAVAPLVSEMLDLLQQADRVDLWYQTTPPLRMPGLPGIRPVLERHAELLLAVAGSEPTPLRAIGLLSQAWCALWRGELAQARTLMELARGEAAWSGETGAVRAHQLALDAVMSAVRGDTAAALAAAQARFNTFASGASGWHRYLLAIFTARIVAACGSTGELRRALRQVDDDRLLLGAGAVAWAGPSRELPLRAQLAWLEGRGDEAIAQWQQALINEDAIDLMGQAAETRVRLAGALVRRGEVAAAAQTLAPVLAGARCDGPGGVLLAGDVLRELAATHFGSALAEADHGPLRSWWQLLAAERAERASPRPDAVERREGASIGAVGALPEPLTARELDVLARIAAGDSNKLIARAFDLSLHTVKRHVANILGKVGVESRGQAAAWYRAQVS